MKEIVLNIKTPDDWKESESTLLGFVIEAQIVAMREVLSVMSRLDPDGMPPHKQEEAVHVWLRRVKSLATKGLGVTIEVEGDQ